MPYYCSWLRLHFSNNHGCNPPLPPSYYLRHLADTARFPAWPLVDHVPLLQVGGWEGWRMWGGGRGRIVGPGVGGGGGGRGRGWAGALLQMGAVPGRIRVCVCVCGGGGMGGWAVCGTVSLWCVCR